MEMQITFTRSKDWVKQQSLLRGENVEDEAEVAVEAIQLSHECRQRILSIGGKYPMKMRGIGFYSNYTPDLSASLTCVHGREFFLIDSDPAAVTTDVLNVAILAAFDRVDAMRQEHLAKEAKRNAEAEAKRVEKEEREAKMVEARKLLARELSLADDYKAERNLLAEFLSNVPVDSLRGALKTLARKRNGETVEALEKSIEDAAPLPFYIFEREDEDEDEFDE